MAPQTIRLCEQLVTQFAFLGTRFWWLVQLIGMDLEAIFGEELEWAELAREVELVLCQILTDLLFRAAVHFLLMLDLLREIGKLAITYSAKDASSRF